MGFGLLWIVCFCFALVYGVEWVLFVLGYLLFGLNLVLPVISCWLLDAWHECLLARL